MRAFIAALAVIATLVLAAPALADLNMMVYTASSTCTGAAQTTAIATGSCVSQTAGGQTARYWAMCNATDATLKTFAQSDSACATPTSTVTFPIGKCIGAGGVSTMVTCSAGAIAFAAVAVVAAVLAMLF